MAYKVSVIIPFYNSEKAIGRCAESLFSQTLSEIEYIFIDDGSEDSSVSVLRNVLEKYEERRKDVVFVSEPVNKGQAAARERGVEMASGDYIIHCDSDDYIEPEMYGAMYDMACLGYDIVECGYWMEKVNGERQKWQFDEPMYHDREKLISELLLDKGLSSLCNKLVSRDLYKHVVFPTADIYEDFAITVQLYINAAKIAYIDRLFYHYVKNVGSSLLPITEEKYRLTRKSRVANVELVCRIIESVFPNRLYRRQLEKLKYDAKNYWLADKTYGCRKEWLDTFPEILPSVLRNSYVGIRCKVATVGRYTLYKWLPALLKLGVVLLLLCACLLGYVRFSNAYVTKDIQELTEQTIASATTGLPILVINTNVPTGWLSKKWKANGQISLFDEKLELVVVSGLKIRGRGNSSWNFPKRSYNLKLDNALGLLGMPAGKKWCLLANWRDRTLMRNAVAFEIARKTGLGWNPHGRFVELVFNGKHVGNYYLCEKISVGKGRMSGHVFEVDVHFDEKWKFVSEYGHYPWMIKDSKQLGQKLLEETELYVNEMEAALFDSVRLNRREFASYLDVETMAEYWIAGELIGASEICYPKSVYFHKTSSGTLEAGPVWDNDWGTFLPEFADTLLNTKQFYYRQLFKDPVFKEVIQEHWTDIRMTLEKDIPVFIDSLCTLLEVSDQRNSMMWPLSDVKNGDELMDFQSAVGRLKDSYLDKLHYMDGKIPQLIHVKMLFNGDRPL